MAEPAPIWGDQNHSSPRAGRHDRPVEVHRPVLVGDVWGGELDFRPFGDEVGESLRLNSGARDIPDVVAHELKSPFGDSSHDVTIVENVSQRVRSDDDDFVIDEVVQELLGHHQYGI